MIGNVLTVLGLALGFAGATAQAPAPSPQVELQMMTYQMVVLISTAGPGESRAPLTSQALPPNAVLYGIFNDNSPLRALAILDVPDAETAKRIFADEPLVKSGRLIPEIHPWFGPKGWFHPPDAQASLESLVFGFLVRGPTTSQSGEQGAEIQRGHLAYMDGLNKQGKLVAAGPMGDDGALRGIVIYRVKDVEEAKALAAGDPAVKAGRLTIEAHPWTTLKGILK